MFGSESLGGEFLFLLCLLMLIPWFSSIYSIKWSDYWGFLVGDFLFFSWETREPFFGRFWEEEWSLFGETIEGDFFIKLCSKTLGGLRKIGLLENFSWQSFKSGDKKVFLVGCSTSDSLGVLLVLFFLLLQNSLILSTSLKISSEIKLG